VWIPLLGMLLAGIVAMQVEVLKLNAGIGRSLERGSALQARNELLRASVSRLSDEQRIERIAAQMGMLMPAPDQLRFVHTGADSTERALGDIHAPSATDFLAALPTIGAPAAPQGTSVNTDPGLTPASVATSSGTAGTPAAGTTDSAGTTPTTDSAGTAGTTSDPSSSDTSSADPTASATPSSSDTTSAGTGTSTPQSTSTLQSTATPVAPTTSSGTTDQSGTSGGAGAASAGG
jgi:cell division protein FtsL